MRKVAPSLIVPTALVCGLLATALEDAAAQDKTFHGFHVGAELGRENIIGGSLVEDVDYLAQDDRAVLSIAGGARLQLDFGLVLGLEGSFGRMDGDLSLSDAVAGLQIEYANDSQTAIGVTAGFALGAERRWLVFGYLSEATRKFDVAIRQNGTAFDQRDEQGMLRFGAGIERNVVHGLNVRAEVGGGRADFGDRQTNINPKRVLEFSFGLLYQF